MSAPIIRIGTRDSKLAQWQADLVKSELEKSGVGGKLVFIKSKGDLHQVGSVTQLGSTGVFTKALDDALLNNEIDIAVHSYKDVPTSLHEDLSVAAVLQRGNAFDVLVCRENFDFLDDEQLPATIATGSVRRKAQWLNRYPHHEVVGIRGNVDSRLQKLKQSGWNGTILALAGLERLNMKHIPYKILDWMLPAPAQGAIAIMTKKNELKWQQEIAKLNHEETAMMTKIEREFMKNIESGCSAPVGTFAWLRNNNVHLRTVVLSLDGRKKIEVELLEPVEQANGLAKKAAALAISKGADKLITT